MNELQQERLLEMILNAQINKDKQSFYCNKLFDKLIEELYFLFSYKTKTTKEMRRNKSEHIIRHLIFKIYKDNSIMGKDAKQTIVCCVRHILD